MTPCPKYRELGSFLYVAMVAAADSAMPVQSKKSTAFLYIAKWNHTLCQVTMLTFAPTCPVGQVRFNFHLPYSNFHLPLKNCMFYNISFKTK